MADATWIYLVRHGATDWNQEYRIQGHTDIPLNDLGRQQSMRLRGRLAALAPHAIYSSDLRRCTETASIALAPEELQMETLASRAKEIRIRPALRERCFGEWEGLNREEISQRYPGLYERWSSREPAFISPGAESHDELRRRVAEILEEAAQECAGGTAVLFSHGGTILTAIGYALGAPVEPRLAISLGNASVTRLCRTIGGWRVAAVNDMCHLSRGEPS